MNKILILFFITTICSAQITIEKPKYLRFPMDSIVAQKLTTSLDDLFSNITDDKVINYYLIKDQAVLTAKTLDVIKEYHNQFKRDTTKIVTHQLNNIYPVTSTIFKITINGFLTRPLKSPVLLLYSTTLIAKEEKEHFKFSIPLKIETQYWKTKKVGNITYHYRNNLNTSRAQLFDKKNKIIANKFGLEPEALNMYMCDNYQETLQLRGITYSVSENGLYRDGYGVVDNIIFSVMNNEDFSHDMLHYYSGKVNRREDRNWIAEEGLAYLWGNGYYTNINGEMITQERLVIVLEDYLKQHPNISLFKLFSEDTKIFNHIASEISARSVIAGIIANEVEKQKGTEGILKLINAGREYRILSFLKVTDLLIGLNYENFNTMLYKFLKRF